MIHVRIIWRKFDEELHRNSERNNSGGIVLKDLEAMRIINTIRRTHVGKKVNHMTVREILLNGKGYNNCARMIPTSNEMKGLFGHNPGVFKALGDGLYEVIG